MCIRDSDYDVIIFPSGAIGSQFEDFVAGAGDSNRQTELRREFGPRSPDRGLIPEEYQGWLGRVTPEATLSPLKDFLEEGGSIVTIGGSTALGKALGLPLKNQLVKDGQRLGREEYYVPGSLLRSRVDNSRLVASGVPTDLPVSFNNSPVFNRAALEIGDTDEIAVQPLAWFDSEDPLISGWAWGQNYLEGGVTMAEAQIGHGMLYLFGPLITRRAQPHGTFKFLFNAIALSNAQMGKI